MGLMKDYLLFLESKGIAEWDEYFEKWHFTVDDIYAPELMKEYKEQKNGTS